MAQMKTLNGYEIVDQTARDTKQNKVLYGSSDPSNTVGNDGDIYVSTTGVDVINDLQSQISNIINGITTLVNVAYEDTSVTLKQGIAQGSNFNDFTISGIYLVHEGTMSNTPSFASTGNGFLIVFSTGQCVIQIFSLYQGTTAIRTKWYNNWFNWKNIT